LGEKMKKILLIIVSIFLICAVAQAEIFYGATTIKKAELGDVTIHGAANLQNVHAQSLLVLGSLNFKNLDVFRDAEVIGDIRGGQNGKFGKLKVTGVVNLTEAIIGALQVIGPLYMDDVTVQGNTIVIGTLVAGNSQFENMTITANQVRLNNVKVGNIYLKKEQLKSKTQQLELEGPSIVGGSITFEAGDGIVVVHKGVSIIGEVKGATIVQK